MLPSNARVSPSSTHSLPQDAIESKYSDIIQLAKQRRQLLVFAYSMFLLYREAGGVKSWILEKVCSNISVTYLPSNTSSVVVL